MSKSSRKRRLDRIVQTAEAHFGQKVQELETPGGEGRSSCRLHFQDRKVIATLRPNFRRAHLEAFVLSRISGFCDDTPKCLGVSGEMIFQSDVGDRRLNVEIARVGRARRTRLAADAVAKIFRVQAAARTAGLNSEMPHLGNNPAWIKNFVNAIDALKKLSSGRSENTDRAALARAVSHPAQQFVKWDCRSGNAAIDDSDVLRWFDFEYAGVRHGAEDLAWLIGDEAWPVAPEMMEDIVRDAYDPSTGPSRDDYMTYLSVYVALHCVQRLKLILKEVDKRGWLSKTRVRKYDDAGVHPEFAAHLCRVGAYFAARQPLTEHIGRDFEEAAGVFETLVAQAA